jgi:cobalamin-dependent methionine synthase I
MTIKELKDWVIRQREVLNLADEDFFADIDETKQDWLEQELITLFDIIAELEEK